MSVILNRCEDEGGRDGARTADVSKARLTPRIGDVRRNKTAEMTRSRG